MRVRWLLLVVVFVLASILATRLISACNPLTDPACCGSGQCVGGKNCNNCPGDCPCGDDEICSSQGVCVYIPPPCESTGCPSVNDVPCNQYGYDNCGNQCWDLGKSCENGVTCYPVPYNCCTPSSVCKDASGNAILADTTTCNTVKTGTLGCGQSCTVTGTQCAIGYRCTVAGCKESCTTSGAKRCTTGTPANVATCNGAYWSDPAPCGTGLNYCTADNNCVACLNDGHCTGTNKYCVSNACVQCKTNNDCGGSTPVCVNNACITGCLKASDCGGRPALIDGAT